MTPVRVWLSRIANLVRSRHFDRDLRDQIDSHIEEATDEYIRQGLSSTDARRAAMRDFGGVAQVEEVCRDARGTWLRDLTKDLHYGVRTLRRNPSFSAVAIVSLAVGIGANTIIFSLVNSLLFRPRAVAHPDELVELYVGERNAPYEACSYPSYVEFRDRNGVFTGLAAYGLWQFRLGDANDVEQIWGEIVSGNYFDLLGIHPQKGRAFGADEDLVPGRNPVVVISHGLWQRRFNADPDLIGRTVSINGQALTVVGIAPPQYTGVVRGLSSDVWIPAMMLPALEPVRGEIRLNSRGSRWLVLVGRLRPGTTIDQARARFELLSREMQANHPDEWRSVRPETGRLRELFVTVLPERDARIHPDLRDGAYAVAALLIAIVNLVLLIACMNLSGMLLARAVARRKEIAVRAALGASRFRIVRQLVAESVLLALIAGAVGVVLTVWLLGLLVAYMPAFPEGVRVALDLHVDWRVLAYALAFSTLTGVLFGLAPAVRSARTEVSAVLKDDSSALTGGCRTSRTRTVLVAAQVAFSVLLLVGAGLVLRSLDKVRPTRLGFSSERVVVATLSLDETRYNRATSQEFYRQLSERMSALPGVDAVSLVQGMPGGFMNRSRRSTEIEGYQPGPGESLDIDFSLVGPHYFTNQKVPIVQGRDFDERDREGAPCVAIINEALARRYFGATGSPLGKHLTKQEGARSTIQHCGIVGIVRDDRWQSLQNEPRPFYAMALQQTHRLRMTLLVHTKGDPEGQIAAVRRTIQALDPRMPVSDVQTVVDYFSTTAYPFRLLAIVMGGCGVMALLLAAMGIYGVVSYSVAQRTREVGIRIALGAMRGDILRTVVVGGMVPVLWGLGIGLLMSTALTPILTSSLFGTALLFGVSATDSLTFAGVAILLASVALAACCIPAVRAIRIDPIEALRYE